MRVKCSAILMSLAASTAKSTAPTIAVPSAEPIVRKSWTEAAAAPIVSGRTEDCTISCTTAMTLPMNSVVSPSSRLSSTRLR
ncbi:hypothetical protein D3C87_1800170 [compost metagenome]